MVIYWDFFLDNQDIFWDITQGQGDFYIFLWVYNII